MGFRLLLAASALFLLPNCGHQTSIPKAPITEVVIFVPGFEGSRLIEAKSEEVRWVNLAEALFGGRQLSLPLPGLGFEFEPLELKAAGVLDSVAVIPGLYSVDAYGSFLSTLESKLRNGIALRTLSYDWRRTPLAAVKELDEMVRREKAAGVKVSVVGHSLGGLIAAYYLRYGTQDPKDASDSWYGATLIEKAALIGVPYLGSMAVFRNMQHGVKVALNTDLLDWMSYSSFEAAYFLLPSGSQDVLLDPSGTRISGLIRTPQNWDRYAWGLAQAKGEHHAARVAYVTRWLENSRLFVEQLQRPAALLKNPGPPKPILSIVGKGAPTVNFGLFLGEKGEGRSLAFYPADVEHSAPGFDQRKLEDDGDGSVSLASATLPKAFNARFAVQEQTLFGNHLDILARRDRIEALVHFLEN